jgi:hypothetical protein
MRADEKHLAPTAHEVVRDREPGVARANDEDVGVWLHA